EAGRSFFDPSMQLKVLFFAYCDGVRSCRAIAKHIRYDIRYRYFCGSRTRGLSITQVYIRSCSRNPVSVA
ncbi:MAG: transposase, partial [candidate division Zixibacteria bacterium]|nr:transposase [candidate division Zixibacteria bacterium]MBU1471770.1 transposase [candidate division Zixibacteria bacterium]MBU2625132.1 transposase [candidate division Zixibacteria bacterium]